MLRKFYLGTLLHVGLGLTFLLLFCEYLVYYVVLTQCEWPTLDPRKEDPALRGEATDRPVRAMFIADTHLLGSREGHWFDKLRREWQMYRAFQTMMTLQQPDVVFVLGDVFDEGKWCGSAEFEYYTKRFHSLFHVPKDTRLYVVAGNHDMGFHYAITPYRNQRFINGMKSPNVRRLSLRDNHFVLINSMALEGDGCFLCRPTEIAVNKIASKLSPLILACQDFFVIDYSLNRLYVYRIAEDLKCARKIGNDCRNASTISRYSRPILLQHYPMYRESDEICNELDQAPNELKAIKFRERWECLSKEASEQLLDILNPRLIVAGHTHHGCRRIHRDDVLEFTIPSFSWRNKNNPSLLMGTFTPSNYSVSKCYMPVESTVIAIYSCSLLCILIYLIIKLRPRRHAYSRVKMP
ncbi:PREDICTED: metallophosphoesterase 1 isoform X1 [Vollenhovia emeryi]|uniref:metallophosphoesterase 1 isoform X1 n=1 Tax=Vollenhovia emeryi TaxID=411798 RepID=UPI0005F4D47B|nr:PREDICTED: metallophosphoesterase 1 isoform X1 [Vollenhovia emeryi]